MNAYLCDNCRTARPPHECAGWVYVTQLRLNDSPLAFLTENAADRAVRQAQAEQLARSPLHTPRHFCSVACASQWLANGCASLLDEARS